MARFNPSAQYGAFLFVEQFEYESDPKAAKRAIRDQVAHSVPLIHRRKVSFSHRVRSGNVYLAWLYKGTDHPHATAKAFLDSCIENHEAVLAKAKSNPKVG